MSESVFEWAAGNEDASPLAAAYINACATYAKLQNLEDGPGLTILLDLQSEVLDELSIRIKKKIKS